MKRFLQHSQVVDRENFIDSYAHASNASTGSEVDSNANVTTKTVATMEAELFKPYTIQINRDKMKKKLAELFDDDVAQGYIQDIVSHKMYVHDETSLRPYCASITLYPFLLEGTKCIGGVSKAPTNLQSFCGSFVNLVYQVAANFAGAIATVEFLHYFDYFARLTYGADYLDTHKKEITQELQGVVYGLNQPSSARGDQSVFWNISVFDTPYLEEMFGDFYYPDGTQPDLKSVMALQVYFLDWFRRERKKELLTFPVVTASLLTTPKGFADVTFRDMCAYQMSRGNSFFIYMSDSVDSLASCCRLRNELADNTFSYTLGAGGVVTGSAQVITINMNRLVQDATFMQVGNDIKPYLRDFIRDVHKYLIASKAIYQEYIDAGLLPAYTAGFMDLDKQFLTIGVNGLVEAAEYLGYTISDNPQYKKWLADILSVFKETNKEGLKTYGVRFNTELVPAENLGVKNAKWDKAEGYAVPRPCYNSYFYAVEDTSLSVLDKIKLYGKEITDSLDGGSALHLNLEQIPSIANAVELFELCRKSGVPYWTTNVLCTICDDCGYINPETTKRCVECGSENVGYGTRIIGYLKRIKNFSEARQKEAAKRFYSHYIHF